MLGKRSTRMLKYLGQTAIFCALIVINPVAAEQPINDPIGPAGLTQIQTQLNSRGVAFSEQAFLKASNAGQEDNFGISAALNEAGNLLVIGARWHTGTDEPFDAADFQANPINVGAAYIFERDALGNWTEVAYLTTSLQSPIVTPFSQRAPEFGFDVAISGATVIVSEPFRSNREVGFDGMPTRSSSGLVYVFEPDSSGDWVETAIVENPGPNPSLDQFGTSVDLEDDLLLVGAAQADFFTPPGQSLNDTGAAYVFERNTANEWQLRGVLEPNPVGQSPIVGKRIQFGWSVDLNGDRILVGAPRESSDGSDPMDISAPRSGAAYLFESNILGEWSRTAWLKASNGEVGVGISGVPSEGDRFGFSVALTPTQAIVGAVAEDSDGSNSSDNSLTDSGALYVFEEDGAGQWQEVQYIKSSTPGFSADLGYALAYDNGILVSGARREDARDGAAYVFRQDSSGVWQEEQRIQSSNGIGQSDWFGQAVAISGSRMAISAWYEDSDPANGPNDNSLERAGAAYVFGLPGLTIGGQVSGLVGQGLILRNTETGDDVSIIVNGSFTFPDPLADGENYAVSVLQQPSNPDQVCTVSNGTGTLSGQDVTDIEVNCELTESFALGGTVSGLSGSGLVLQNNAGDNLPIASNGPFTFGVELANGAGYEVSVLTQPGNPAQSCSVTNGSGTISGADIDTVQIDCVDAATFSLGGTATGVDFPSLVVQNNGGNDITIFSPGGPFTFTNELVDGAAYEVTVFGQSVNSDYICTVSNGVGTINGADVTNVLVTCELRDTFPIVVDVSGLAGSGLVLQNNGGDDLAIPSNGTFTFATELNSAEPYSVTVATQPSNPPQACLVNNGSGVAGSVGVINVDVICETAQYEIGGTVSGLTGPGLILQNNGGDNLMIASDGPFTFSTLIEDAQPYSVTILQQPDDAAIECVVTNGIGVVNGMNVDDVQVSCSMIATFTIGGTISGLEGGGLVLQNNDGDDLSVETNGAFEFDTALTDGASYAVTVATQPADPSQSCSVINGTGTISSADVSDIRVNCVTNTFTVSGTITGLEGDGLVLQNNGGDDQMITNDGGFAFSPQEDGSTYNVTILTQPSRSSRVSQTCTVSNGTGTINGGDVSDVAVTCETNTFTIGGTVSGLSGDGLILQNNGADDLTVSANGAFSFDTPLDDGTAYAVTVLNQPSNPNQTCVVNNASGTVDGEDVNSVEVECAEIQISLSATQLSFDTSADPISQSLTVSNPGSADLEIISISAPTDPFELAGGDCLAIPVTLAPGESCRLDVRFAPTMTGEFSSSIQISSTASSSPDQIDLRGSFLPAPMVVPVNHPLALILMLIGMLLLGLRWQIQRA